MSAPVRRSAQPSMAAPLKPVLTALDTMAQGTTPLIKAATQTNLEVFGLAARRGQAWLEIPTRAAQCRTLADVMMAHVQFWQTAFQQYTQSSQRVMAHWTAVAAQMPLARATASQPTRAPRDYLTVPETATNGSGTAAPAPAATTTAPTPPASVSNGAYRNADRRVA